MSFASSSTQEVRNKMPDQQISARDIPDVDVMAVFAAIPAQYRRWVVAGCMDFLETGKRIEAVNDIEGLLAAGDWAAAIDLWKVRHEKIGGYPTRYVGIGNVLWAAMQEHGCPAGARELIAAWATEFYGARSA